MTECRTILLDVGVHLFFCMGMPQLVIKAITAFIGKWNMHSIDSLYTTLRRQ